MARLICLLWLCGASLAFTQSATSSGTIQVQLRDPSGSSVAEASLILRHKASGATRTGKTESQGSFVFSQLSPGEYSLHIEKDGFTSVDATSIPVSIGQLVEQKLTLALSNVASRIEVTESAGALDTGATSSSAALGNDRIEEAPSNGRNYFSFVAVAPGVVSSPQAGAQKSMAGIRNPLADSGFSFNGMRGRNNSISIDGVDNRDETTGGNRVAIGLEMVEQFSVAGVSVGAELGGAAGGIVNMVTRPGTNLWHGDATFFFQNGAFSARKPEVDAGFHPRLSRYQPGTSLNGPIKKNRTFFSTAFETEKAFEEEWSETPSDAIELIRKAFQSPAFANGLVKDPYHGLFRTATRGTEYSLKVNHIQDEHDTYSARYAYSRGRVLGDVQGGTNFSDRSSGGSSLTSDHAFVASWLRVLTPKTTNDVRFQLSQRSQEVRPNSYGPLYEIPGLISMGQSPRLNSDRTETHYELVDSLSFVRGRHRMSAGISVQPIHLDARLANRAAGIFVFPSLNDFLAGRPDVFTQAFGDPSLTMKTTPFGLYFQDRWRIINGFTLEAGVRMDKQAMPQGLPASKANIAPRIGLAWNPSKNLVFRFGGGLFYDRYPLAYLNEALWKNGTRGFEQYAVGAAAVQAFQILRGGTASGPLPGVAQSTYTASSNFPSPYSRKAGFGAEYALDKDTKLTVEANSVKGVHLPRIRNAAGALPPNYLLEQTANSNYRGVSTSINRRMSKEVAYLFTYDLSRNLDDGSDFDEQPLNPLNIRADWAHSRLHQHHRLAASAVFEIPDDALKVAPVWLRESFERITIAPIMSFLSGRPLSGLLTTDFYRTGAYPINARPVGVGRNSFQAPATATVDLRLMKTFMTHHERAKLQFGIEAFNLLNHSNVAISSPYYANGIEKLTTFRGPVESLNRRQFQTLVQWEF